MDDEVVQIFPDRLDDLAILCHFFFHDEIDAVHLSNGSAGDDIDLLEHVSFNSSDNRLADAKGAFVRLPAEGISDSSNGKEL